METSGGTRGQAETTEKGPVFTKSSAAIYSLIQTAMENDLNPQAYLKYVFKQIQQRNDIGVGKMLPWAEEIPENCKMLIKRS